MNEYKASPQDFDWWQEIVVEFLLFALTLVTLNTLGGLFTEPVLMPVVLFFAFVIHLLWALARRLNLPNALAIVLNLAITAALFVFLRYSSDSPRLPGDEPLQGGILASLRADMQAAIDTLGEGQIPLQLNTGILVFVILAMFFLTALADWSAFRLRSSSADAVVGHFLILGIVVLIGQHENRLQPVIWFALVGLSFVLAHRLFANPKRLLVGVTQTAAVGALMLALVIPFGAIGGQSIKAEGESPDLSDLPSRIGDMFSGEDGSGPIELGNPLVNIQAELHGSALEEVFRVTSEEPSYWRKSVLDEFDGSNWSASYDYDSAGSGISPSVMSGTGETRQVRQVYEIDSLATDWLPAAFEPVSLALPQGIDLNVDYDPGTSTLLLRQQEDQDGSTIISDLTYEIISEVPNYSPERLREFSFAGYTQYNNNLLEEHLALKGAASDYVQAEAFRVTNAAESPFDKALLLQNWFRSEFLYDLEVAEGHSFERIEDFIDPAVRRGYCEQFAAAYAVMARVIGIPSRVVVGFTQGELESNNPDGTSTYQVRARNYHAWPEVLIPGAGWVAMEPTPSRGSPTAVEYTGVLPQQDESDPIPPPATTLPPTPEEQFLPELLPTELPELPELPDIPTPSVSIFSRVLQIAIIVLAGAVGLAIALWGLGLLRQHVYRKRIDGDYSSRIALAWQKTLRECSSAGIKRTPSTTAHELAGLVSGSLPTIAADSSPRMPELADLVAHVNYSPYSPTLEDAESAESIQVHMRHKLSIRKPWYRRYLPPLPLLQFAKF